MFFSWFLFRAEFGGMVLFVSCLLLRFCCWVRNGWMGDGFWCFSLRGFVGFFFLSFLLSLHLTPLLSSIYLAFERLWLFRWEELYEETEVPTNSV